MYMRRIRKKKKEREKKTRKKKKRKRKENLRTCATIPVRSSVHALRVRCERMGPTARGVHLSAQLTGVGGGRRRSEAR
jgi:hypothetical protein